VVLRKNHFPVEDINQYLHRAESVIFHTSQSALAERLQLDPAVKLRVGVDLGTAYLVLVVLDESGNPLAGEWQFAQVVRDGLVVDFIGATDLLRGMKARVEQRLGRSIEHAVSGYPPGVPLAEVRATANVIEAAGIACPHLVDEPSAANEVLGLREGAIVDVGGGTTGIAVLKDGKVIFTADEATGGTHFSLVIAGSMNIPFEEAEQIKVTVAEQKRLFPTVRPVMEKVGNIIARNVAGMDVKSIMMVGGGSAFLGMGEVVQEYTGIPTQVAPHPVFITPIGFALQDSPEG
jgi:ethanolamine utilization protein EutJ